ncbi:MAG: translation initiation factor IF-3 [Dongiaceae bacterium]
MGAGPRPGGGFDRNRREEAPAADGPRINRFIQAATVRVIDAKGQMLGVIGIQEALAKAAEAGLDLVEVSPDATPPVCKIMDYGKYRYQEQKKKAEARKKQKTIDVKEIKLRPMIDPHDLGIKIKQMKGFLEDGDKVKVSMRFRGREAANQAIGMEVLKKVETELSELGKTESGPRFEGSQVLMLIGPK